MVKIFKIPLKFPKGNVSFAIQYHANLNTAYNADATPSTMLCLVHKQFHKPLAIETCQEQTSYQKQDKIRTFTKDSYQRQDKIQIRRQKIIHHYKKRTYLYASAPLL